MTYMHTHTHTHTQTRAHSVGLLWKRIGLSQRPPHDNTQRSQEIKLHALGGILTLNPNKLVAADARVRPRGDMGIYRLN